jgi:hypothetical protein
VRYINRANPAAFHTDFMESIVSCAQPFGGAVWLLCAAQEGEKRKQPRKLILSKLQ